MHQKNDFKIKTEQFEGPMEVLLDLIEKRKLSINELSLSNVTDDFISYVKSKDAFPMDESAQFILVASILLLIKSKSLLPNLELTEDEEQSVEDLELRLKLYKLFKELSIKIGDKYGDEVLYSPTKAYIFDNIFAPSKDCKLSLIHDVARDMIKTLPQIYKIPEKIVKKVISLEEMITGLTERIKEGIKMSFNDFSKETSKGDRVNIIVSFLALLELVKRGSIEANQTNRFDDIEFGKRIYHL